MKLTSQEARVFRLLFEDLSLKEIGAQLQISDKTVSCYLHRIVCKYGCESRFGLISAVWSEAVGISLQEMLGRLNLES